MKRFSPLSPFENSIQNIRVFNKNSVFYYYLKLMLVVFLIPFVIFNSIMITNYYKNTTLQSEMSARQSFANAKNSVANLLSETERVYFTILRDPTMTAFLTAPTLDDMGYYFKHLSDLDEMVDNYADISNSIENITVYSKSCNYVLARGGNGYIEGFADTPWYQNQNEDSNYYFLSEGDKFYICYNIFANNKSSGLVVFKIEPDFLFKNQYSDCSVVLSDTKHHVFYSLNTINRKFMSYPTAGVTDVVHKDKSFILSSQVESIFITMQIQQGRSYTLEIVLYILGCIILTLIIAFVFALAVSLKSYSTLDKILMEINEPYVPRDSQSANEISFITSSFMEIRTKNTSLEEELTTSAYALKQMQLEALQMQFNPHFLFNALNSLSMKLTKEHGINSPYSSLIVLLSDILCESLNTAHYLVHISEEITYAKKYLDFQKLADSYLFDTIWEVEEDVLNCYTVKLSMQPIIENAIKHGIKSLRNETKGVIKIQIFSSGENVVFCISNTSSTIDTQTLDAINSSLESGEMPASKNIGLKNVNKRIRLVFGEEYGCRVYTKEDTFIVETTIPKVDEL